MSLREVSTPTTQVNIVNQSLLHVFLGGAVKLSNISRNGSFYVWQV